MIKAGYMQIVKFAIADKPDIRYNVPPVLEIIAWK
jgi:hypothetical protein